MALEQSDQPAQRGKAASATAPGTAAPPHIPDHELLRRIGGGSYGEVWLARNIMGTFRAVKMVYRRHFEDERPYEREFSGIQKFEPLSRSHEGLVDVLQMGRNEEAGYFYYVMELADCALLGGTACRFQQAESPSAPAAAGPAPERVNCLEACVRHGSEQYRPATVRTAVADHGRLPFEQCLSIGLAMASALEHLHSHGLVHRDVKPSNIILVNGIPKLADIGLVTGTDATVSFVGTEGFIPPEGPGTVQADIFGLGKVLYELTTGKDRHDFPEPPTLLGEFADRAELLELDEVIQKACAADPRRRYRSAAQMHEDLLLVKTGKSVRDKHALERRLKLMTRAGAVAAVVLALGAVAYGLAVREVGVAEGAAKREAELREQAEQATLDTKAARRQERKHRVQAEAEAKKAENEAAKSQQVSAFLQSLLGSVDPAMARGRDTTVLREILEQASRRAGKELKDQPEVQAQLCLIIGVTYWRLGALTNAATMTREAVRLRRSALGGEHPAVASALANLGAILYETSDARAAELVEREAVAIQCRLVGGERTNLATTLNNLGLALQSQGKLAEAETAEWEALAIRKQWLGDFSPDVGMSLNNVALLQCQRGDFTGAETNFAAALLVARKVLSEECPFIATLQNNLAEILKNKGDLDAALALHLRTLAIREKLYPQGHPDVAYTLNQLAAVLVALGDLGGAESRLRKAREMEEKLQLTKHPYVADSVATLALLQQKKGDLSAAEASQRQALTMRKELSGDESLEAADSNRSLALLEAVRGDFDAAEQKLRQSLVVGRAVQGEKNLNLVPALRQLAWVLGQRGAQDARESLSEAVDIAAKSGPYGVFTLTESMFEITDLLQGLGRFAEVEPLLQEAAEYLRDPLCISPLRRRGVERLVRFYDAWARARPDPGVSAKAADWKKQLEGLTERASAN